jgi:hypothetical protein
MPDDPAHRLAWLVSPGVVLMVATADERRQLWEAKYRDRV